VEKQDTEESKNDTNGQEQQSAVDEPFSSMAGTDSREQSEKISGEPDSHNEQCKYNDVTTKFPVSANQDDFEGDSKGGVPGISSACSGRFPSDFDVTSSEDVISTEPTSRDVASSSESVEKVVNRWQSSDNCEGSDCNEPRPKRSAIRRNSLEGGKRKSVTFVPTVNVEAADADDTMDRDSAGHVDEKETERFVYQSCFSSPYCNYDYDNYGVVITGHFTRSSCIKI
jgi:hypothetical protein